MLDFLGWLFNPTSVVGVLLLTIVASYLLRGVDKLYAIVSTRGKRVREERRKKREAEAQQLFADPVRAVELQLEIIQDMLAEVTGFVIMFGSGAATIFSARPTETPSDNHILVYIFAAMGIMTGIIFIVNTWKHADKRDLFREYQKQRKQQTP